MLPVIILGPLHLYSFGLMFGCAICVGWYFVMRYLREHGIVISELVLGLCIMVSGFIGAKLDFGLIEGRLFDHAAFDWSSVLHLRGGYVYLGCIVAGTLGGLAYAIVRRLPLLCSLDAMFCVAPAYAVGRIGCFLAGDGDYGVASNLPWAVSFPHGEVPTLLRVHPTMLYSSAWELMVFAILWRLSRPTRPEPFRPGTLFGLYLLATGTGRFLVEFLSRNPRLVLGMSEAQLVSLGFMAGGGCVLLSLHAVAAERIATPPKLPVRAPTLVAGRGEAPISNL